MRYVRTLASVIVIVALGLTKETHAQDAAASQPVAKPATETAPSSRPAEVRARHPRIGVRCEAVALDHQKIARVEAVLPGSPAERAGMKVGDVILKAAGEEIRDDKTFRDVLAKRRAGDTITIVVNRGGSETDLAVTLVDKLQRTEPVAVTIQHVLIMCGDRPNPKGQKRTAEEAKKIADDVLVRAKNGADFASLVKSLSEDQGSINNDPPGSYVMANEGKPKPVPTAHDRAGMVAGFGAVSFSLEIGDIAMSPYDPELSPFGYHVIKRVK